MMIVGTSFKDQVVGPPSLHGHSWLINGGVIVTTAPNWEPILQVVDIRRCINFQVDMIVSWVISHPI